MDLNASKALAMVALGGGSMAAGMIPACHRTTATDPRGSLGRSLLLCFGGGVLLATALLHMLPEARETLPEHGDLAFCAGFFLIYMLDELVHLVWGRPLEELSRPSRQAHYGCTEETSLLGRDTLVAAGCHTTHTEPCTRTSAGRGGLLVALSSHALLEGIAIGLEKSPQKVLLLLGAVASHKFVVGFCLGVEINAAEALSLLTHFVAIAVFSLGSVVGIGLGMIVEGTSYPWTNIALGSLQGLAGGTLLYVTLSEVLPRERARWHQGPRAGGLYQFLATSGGFIVMYLINKYLDAEHDPGMN